VQSLAFLRNLSSPVTLPSDRDAEFGVRLCKIRIQTQRLALFRDLGIPIPFLSEGLTQVRVRLGKIRI
jgi:hypothetical protein